MWILGYASLIWNPEFDYEEKCVGYVQGFARRFNVISFKCRGVPEKTGRCAGLIEDPEAICWCVAYRVKDEDFHRIVQKLAPREEMTDMTTMKFYPRDQTRDPFDVKAYWVIKRTPEFLNDENLIFDEDPAITAERIATCVGTMGPNIEYFQKISEFLRNIDVEDPYVSELERLIKPYLDNK